jgi:hypothetical protein
MSSRFHLVEYLNGKWFSLEGDDIEQLAKERGYEREGSEWDAPHRRSRYHKLPTFKGLHGPCGSDPIRYENWAASDLLSN